MLPMEGLRLSEVFRFGGLEMAGRNSLILTKPLRCDEQSTLAINLAMRIQGKEVLLRGRKMD